MSLMSIQDLAAELNDMVSMTGDLQTEDNLQELHHYYIKMFQKYCDEVPVFEIIDNRGTIELKKSEFK